MFNVLQISTGYSDGSVEKGIIEENGGLHTLISSETEEDIIAAGRQADGLLVALTKVSKTVINALPGLKIIVRAGIGLDNIDLPAAKARGIKVYNLPHYCQNEVADHTIALLLAMERRLTPQLEDIRNGNWNPVKNYMPINGLDGAVLGLIGCGGIAQKVIKRAKPFGLKIVCCDPYVSEISAKELEIDLVSLNNLLETSDFISLHIPLTEETKFILNKDAFEKMKPNVYIINTARGPLIDNNALYSAVTEGRIWGAALDTIDGDAEGAVRFSGFENILITPHTAYYSEISNWKIRAQAGELFAKYISGTEMPFSFT